MRARARQVMTWVERNPATVDWTIALVFSAAAVISLSATIELLHPDPAFADPAKAGIIVSLLAGRVPLGFGRRHPLSLARGGVGAFVVGRLTLRPHAPLPPG